MSHLLTKNCPTCQNTLCQDSTCSLCSSVRSANSKPMPDEDFIANRRAIIALVFAILLLINMLAMTYFGEK